MPNAPDSSYSYEVTSYCSGGYGVVKFFNITTQPNTEVQFNLTGPNGYAMSSQVFPAGTVNADAIFESLLDGAYNYTISKNGTIYESGAPAIGIDCAGAGNTGFKAWTILEQYFTDDNTLTGEQKPNTAEDPDYVAPVNDPTTCPLP